MVDNRTLLLIISLCEVVELHCVASKSWTFLIFMIFSVFQNYYIALLHCTGGFVTSWVLTKLTWPSLAESLYNFCSTLFAFRSFILCFLDGYNKASCNGKLYLVKGGLASGSIILTSYNLYVRPSTPHIEHQINQISKSRIKIEIKNYRTSYISKLK